MAQKSAEFWKSHVLAWRRSGSSATRYAQVNGLKKWAFLKAIQRVRRRETSVQTAPVGGCRRAQAHSEGVEFVEVPIVSGVSEVTKVVPVETSGISIEVACGHVVRVGPDCSVELLKKVMTVLNDFGRPHVSH